MQIRLKILLVLLVLSLCAVAFAQMGSGGRNAFSGHHNSIGQGAGNLLTDAQKQELHELINNMRDQGATRDEIKEAVDGLFAEWGIEKPENDGQFWHRNWRGRYGFGDPQLSDEQREILRATIQELREAGATHEEIKTAVEALYAEWGLQIPERPAPWGDLLTAEQLAELKATIQDLKDQGATREEIKAAVDALFEAWGIERPQFGEKMGRRHGKHGTVWMNQLTEEQRAIIREMIQTMKEAGATREEIREAVKKQLQEWGIGDGGDDKEGTLELKEDERIKATNAPNPFNPSTTITYAIKEPGHVSVKIYNTKGQLIRDLVDEFAAEGSHAVVWDGLNERGELVSSGLYFYKIITSNGSVTERMMMMK